MNKILIVDDSAFMRNILKDLLMDPSEGPRLNGEVTVFEADGKVTALRQLKTIKPDIILLDIVMKESETEGLEFIEEIKDSYNTGQIIIISSIGQLSVLDDCRKLGVSAYLQKPFEREKVIDAVNKILK